MISRVEITRKVVHLASLSIPIGYACLSREVVLTVVFLLFLGFLAVDLLRHYHNGLGLIFRKYLLGTVLREEERKKVMGATYLLFSSFLTVLLFSKPVAITSLLILIISDTAAALVGRGIGKTPVFGKTLEGSLAFLLSSLLIVWSYPHLNRLSGTLACLAATVVELLPTGINDNLTIPLVSGAIISLGGA
jgi:dolichol kinase